MTINKELPGYTPPLKLQGRDLEIFSHNINLLRQNGGKLDPGFFPFQVPEIDDTLPKTDKGIWTDEAITQRAAALKLRFPTEESIQEYILTLKTKTNKRLSMETTRVKCPDCKNGNLVHFSTEHETGGFGMIYCYCPHCAGGLLLTQG